VVQSPGCLNFSLVLAMTARDEFATAGGTNASIMKHHAEVLSKLTGEHVEVNGFSDLTIAGKKFSGNAQRRQLRYFLFHGCFLLNADLNLMEELLPLPPKQPVYRDSRSHATFVRNLSISPQQAKLALRNAWNVRTVEHSIPRAEIDRLVHERYANPSWNAL
jgi:lipoate-protein ligase A